MDRPSEVHSIYKDCKEQADKYKWIRSEEVGYDLGEHALFEWGREHWPKHLRVRWAEHIRGVRFWVELGHSDFGLLLRNPHRNHDLLMTIVHKLENGDENLNIIWWAYQQGVSTEEVIEILEKLDINSKRLPYRV